MADAKVQRVGHGADAGVVQLHALKLRAGGLFDERGLGRGDCRVVIFDQEVGSLAVSALKRGGMSEREVATDLANALEVREFRGESVGCRERLCGVHRCGEVGNDGQVDGVVSEGVLQGCVDLARLRVGIAVSRRLEAGESLQTPHAGPRYKCHENEQGNKRFGEHEAGESLHPNKLNPRKVA